MDEIRTTESGVSYLRTPDERFGDLADFPYEPGYVDVDGLRMAYIDEGIPSGPTLLLLHGEPTWSFLYRRMIPPLVDAGFRCIAPDLIGFGRSDKPVDRAAYTYEAHVAWMKSFLDAIDAPASTLFAQDWGGLIGLRVAAEEPERFERIVIGNTGLPVGESLGPGFDGWLEMSQTMEVMDAGAMLQIATRARDLTDAEMNGYRAPFPDEQHMAGAREFPCLVPITPEHGGVAENLAAWEQLEQWEKPFLTLWCPGDTVLGHLGQEFIDRVPGAAGEPHQLFEPGGHFLQDDRGEDIAAAIIDWFNVFPVAKQAGQVLVDSGGGPPNSSKVVVTDVSNTDLPGTVIYDEIVPFKFGQYTPADPATGTAESGDEISGSVQTRVERSTSTGTLIFSFRFREVITRPFDPNDNFIELVTFSGFEKFFPVEAFFIDTSQSDGGQVLDDVIQVYGASGDIQFSTSLSNPNGTTWFCVLTTAKKFRTGKFLDFGNAGNNMTRDKITLDKIAAPTK